jgi:hypothetical protein
VFSWKRGLHLLRTTLLRRKPRAFYLAAFGLILVALVYVLQPWDQKPPPDTVDAHYQRLLSLRHNLFLRDRNHLKNLLSVRAVVWCINGRPTISEQFQEMEIHKDALIRLNFFDKQSFHLASTNTTKAMREFIRVIGADRIWRMETINGEDGIVWITACKEDMPQIESIIRKLNAQTNP